MKKKRIMASISVPFALALTALFVMPVEAAAFCSDSKGLNGSVLDASDVMPEEDADGLEAFYDFNDAADTRVTLGRIGGGVKPSYAKMLKSQVLSFINTPEDRNNPQSYAKVSNPFKDEDVEGVTISLWVSLNSNTQASLWRFCRSEQDLDNTGDDGGDVLQLNSNGMLRYNNFKNDGTWFEKFFANGSLEVNKMSMVTLTLSATRNVLYVDGRLVDEQDLGNGNANMMAFVKSAEVFCIGVSKKHSAFSGGNGYASLYGYVDNLSFYSKILSAQEVQGLYAEQQEQWTGDFAEAAKTMEDGGSLGVTYLVKNARLDVSRDGWTTTGGKGLISNGFNHWDSDTYKGSFLESIISNADNPDLIWQDIENLIPGRYRITANVGGRSAIAEPANTTCPTGLELFANNGSTTVSSMVLDEFSAEGVVAADGKLRVGVRINGHVNYVWCGLSNVRLEYLGVDKIELDESQTEAFKTSEYANVTMARKLKGDDKWNTLCVPFDMTAEQIAANGITEVRELTDAKKGDGDNLTLTFTKVETIEAGKPYIVRAKANTSLMVEGVAVKPDEPQSVEVGGIVSMKGNYAATSLANKEFFISDNAFYVADQKVTLNGFRAYLKVSEAMEAPVNRMLIDIDGVATSVDEVFDADIVDADRLVDVYTLSGMSVKRGVRKSEALDGLAKGIYVVDGKKLVK